MRSQTESEAAWDEPTAESWLLSLELFGIDFGLDRIKRLLESLGGPQQLPRLVHVVGSNGKSSVTRMTAAIVAAHGLKVGAYLSPHFVSFTERILINGAPCDPQQFGSAAQAVSEAATEIEREQPSSGPITQFEALTAIAFVVFKGAGVDAAVIEAGLGGRLDATNVIDSSVQVCTGVALEHTALLGDTVELIATEKLAVVKPGGTLVVTADLDPAALDVALVRCAEESARLVVAGRDAPKLLAAQGEFQRSNFALAAAAAHALLGALDARATERAAAEIRIPGRYEICASEPTTILDGAHNVDGAAALRASLERENLNGKLIGCLSVLDDKDAEAMLSTLGPCSDQLFFTRATHPRALDPAELAATNERLGGPPSLVVDSPHDALRDARAAAGAGGLVYAAGSLYLIADLKRSPDAKGGSTL